MSTYNQNLRYFIFSWKFMKISSCLYIRGEWKVKFTTEAINASEQIDFK